MAHPYNSGPTVSIALQFCTVKGAKKDMAIILMIFSKKSYLGRFGHFGPKMVRPYNFGYALKFVFFNFPQ